MLYENPQTKFGGTWVKMSSGRYLYNTPAEDNYTSESLKEQELPNVTGHLTSYSYNQDYSGPFSSTRIGNGPSMGSGFSWNSNSFNLAWGNPIYKDGANVTPPSIRVHMWRRTS